MKTLDSVGSTSTVTPHAAASAFQPTGTKQISLIKTEIAEAISKHKNQIEAFEDWLTTIYKIVLIVANASADQQPLLEKWLADQVTQKNLGRSEVSTYHHDIAKLAQFVESKPIDKYKTNVGANFTRACLAEKIPLDKAIEFFDNEGRSAGIKKKFKDGKRKSTATTSTSAEKPASLRLDKEQLTSIIEKVKKRHICTVAASELANKLEKRKEQTMCAAIVTLNLDGSLTVRELVENTKVINFALCAVAAKESETQVKDDNDLHETTSSIFDQLSGSAVKDMLVPSTEADAQHDEAAVEAV